MLRLPLVPVIVKVNVPLVVRWPVVTVKVEAPLEIEAGLKFPWARFGKAETLKLTVPVKPLSGATVTV